MEFIKPLQNRLGNIGGNRGAWSWNTRQRSWNTLRAFQGQQAAFLHQSSKASRASNLLWRIKQLGRNRNVRWQSSKSPSPNPTAHLGSPEPQTLSARMRKLSREYGWSALGVYLGLSVLDFPFCFLAVRWLGTERIGRWEHAVIEAFWDGVEKIYPDARSKKIEVMGDGEREGGDWSVEGITGKAKPDSAGKILLSRG